MRVILAILAIVVVVAIAAVATGFVSLHSTPGSLPKVALEGGRLPTVSADVAKVEVGTKKSTVEVPTVAVRKPQ